MTTQQDVYGHNNYKPMLDKGFIGIADEELHDGTLVPSIMGNDKSIARAARMSYGEGTKTINDDENLIRYLLRHEHTTPLEMCEIKFHAKMPIFVARQWVRHRTASINEYSARYSILTNEFYIPVADSIQPQSSDNKQGRAGQLSGRRIGEAQDMIRNNSKDAYAVYEALLDEDGDEGIARELARMTLPTNGYTEWYWKANLHNIMRFIRLRMDPHAQFEIRVYAEAMYELMKEYFPIAMKAFDDYILHAEKFTRMEIAMLKEFFNRTKWESYCPSEKFEKTLMLDFGMTKRELQEFKKKMNL